MNKSAKLASCFAIAVAAMAYFPATAATVDVIDATSGQANTFFVPALGQELDSPYYRGSPNSAGAARADDWGWQHSPVVGYTTAILNISAFDVDFSSGERDAIYIGSKTGPGPFFLGFLTGANDAFSFANFDVSNPLYAPLLASGLEVWMAINTGSTIDPNGTLGWLVSLSKSVLTTDGADPGNPNPGTTPLPAALPLFAGGLGGLGLLAWRKKKKAAI